MVKNLFIIIILVLSIVHVQAADNKILDIYYGPEQGASDYEKEQCFVDIHLPSEKFKDFPVLVYFHGGGLYGSKRNHGGPIGFTSEGVAVVIVSYRLFPRAKATQPLEDAARAVAWVFKNIEKYGADPKKIFVTGNSAGAYLAAMVGMDKSLLGKYGIDADDICGLIPRSPQMLTHFRIKMELKGMPARKGISDEFSPMFHIRKTKFPIFLQCGSNDYPARQEENLLFVAMMKKLAAQPDNLICYREYPGTHQTFWNKGVPDFKDFILEKSGLKEPSGYFTGVHKYSPDTSVIAREYDGKYYLELDTGIPDNIKNKEIDLGGGKLNFATSRLLETDSMPEQTTGTLKISENVKIVRIPETKNFELKNSPKNAIELELKKGSRLKMWTDADMLNMTLTVKDNNIIASPNEELWHGSAFEFFVDRTPLKGFGETNEHEKQVKQYLFAVKTEDNRPAVSLFTNKADDETGAIARSEITADGYILNVKIPLLEISPLGNPKQVIGITFQRCYFDEKGKSYKEYFISDKPSHLEFNHYSLFKISAF